MLKICCYHHELSVSSGPTTKRGSPASVGVLNLGIGRVGDQKLGTVGPSGPARCRMAATRANGRFTQLRGYERPVEGAYFILEGCITVGRDLHLRFETRANKPPVFRFHGTANNSGASRPPASTAGSIGTPIFPANRFPVQEPHPPIWVGGHSRAALRRAARHGDGWHPVGAVAASPLPPQEPPRVPVDLD